MIQIVNQMFMKKIIVSVFSLLLLFTVFASITPSYAQAAAANSYVAGKVTQGGNPVNGASVQVTCSSVVLNTTTNASGDYLVTYAYATCPDGTLAHATATKGSAIGSASSDVNHFGEPLNIDLAVINPVLPVPEFGFLGYAVASLGSVGAFFALRKRVV